MVDLLVLEKPKDHTGMSFEIDGQKKSKTSPDGFYIESQTGEKLWIDKRFAPLFSFKKKISLKETPLSENFFHQEIAVNRKVFLSKKGLEKAKKQNTNLASLFLYQVIKKNKLRKGQTFLASLH